MDDSTLITLLIIFGGGPFYLCAAVMLCAYGFDILFKTEIGNNLLSKIDTENKKINYCMNAIIGSAVWGPFVIGGLNVLMD